MYKRQDLDKTKSNYGRHLMMHNHNDTDISTNFKSIHVCGKGRLMEALEEFEIYKSFKDKNINSNSILNEQLRFQSHSLYDTALNIIAHDGNDW